MPSTAWPARLRGRRGARAARRAQVDERLAAAYVGAMHAVRELGDALVVARERGADVEERRRLHARVDQELVKAIAAATAIHQELFRAAGGRHHAEANPQVLLWWRRLNDALTVRSQHQLAQSDDAGVMTPAAVRPPSRAPYGPHQAGLHFDVEEPRRPGDADLPPRDGAGHGAPAAQPPRPA